MTKKALLQSLEKSLGVVTTACKAVGLHRATFYTYYNEDEQFKAKVDELENMALDFAESQLHKQKGDGSTSATIFYLKTKGKKRGYVERQELTGADGKDLAQPDLSKYSTQELKELINQEDEQSEEK